MEMEIQKRRVENKITYAEAAKQVKGQARDQRSQSGVSVEGKNEVSEEIFEKKN